MKTLSDVVFDMDKKLGDYFELVGREVYKPKNSKKRIEKRMVDEDGVEWISYMEVNIPEIKTKTIDYIWIKENDVCISVNHGIAVKSDVLYDCYFDKKDALTKLNELIKHQVEYLSELEEK